MPKDQILNDRYRVGRIIGSGSMGVVVSAIDEHTGDEVAVKQLRLLRGTSAEEAEELRIRTKREAAAIGALDHPNVISLLDVGQFGGVPYIVMELVRGASLSALLNNVGQLSDDQSACIGFAVAGALGSAHEAGIIHRDIKPGNVLVTADGSIRLTDFGIARNINDSTITHTGIVLGSPAYMAPEVASGKEITPAADAWSLGAMLFAAVSGIPPYDVNGDALATMTEVVNGPVPKLPVDSALTPVIAALLKKKPADRITLTEAKDRLAKLLPADGKVTFDVDGIEHEHEGSSASFTPVLSPFSQDFPPKPRPSESSSGSLAADPGPLPFMTMSPSAPRRSGRAQALVFAVAILVFVGCAATSFAAARTLADQPLLPPKTESVAVATIVVAPSATGQAPVTLTTRVGHSSVITGTSQGDFSIGVPTDYTSFVVPRVVSATSTNLVVHYVSPDGQQDLTVEYWPKYFPGNFASYPSIVSPGSTVLSVQNWPSAPNPDLYSVTTRNEETATGSSGATNLSRTTYMYLQRKGTSLWAVTLTVPTSQEDAGSRLFGTITPTFKITDG
jgi:serine/threonine protein kinase